MLSSKKILCIMAHPDDEVVYGWPIMQNKSIDRYLVISMDDYSKYGNKKREATSLFCKREGIKILNHIHSDGRYFKMNREPEPLSPMEKIDELVDSIKKAISKVHPDYLFTHNPWGEGGNSAHQLISNIVINTFIRYPVLFTDICDNNLAWFSFKKIPRMWKGLCSESNKICQVDIDQVFYSRGHAVYDKFEVWTGDEKNNSSWNCSLYVIL